jgi:predicted nucleic-acid-binding protein
MIAVDTNVLLRYLLEDDPKQSPKAAKLINGLQSVLITDGVLVETIWTLKGRKYQQKKTALIVVIQSLFEESNIRFEDGHAVWMALSDYRAAKRISGKEADFADALVASKAKSVANFRRVELKGIYTFDVAAQQFSGMLAPE